MSNSVIQGTYIGDPRYAQSFFNPGNYLYVARPDIVLTQELVVEFEMSKKVSFKPCNISSPTVMLAYAY